MKPLTAEHSSKAPNSIAILLKTPKSNTIAMSTIKIERQIALRRGRLLTWYVLLADSLQTWDYLPPPT